MSSFLGPLGLGRDASGVYIAFPQAKVGLTAEGGMAVKKINRTGAPTMKGTLVETDGYGDFSFDLAEANSNHPVGVVYENNVPNGGYCWIVISGVVEILIKDGTTATAGYWVQTSDVPGRVNITLAAPPGGGIPEADQHFREVGHCINGATSGTDKLALIFMHFN